MRQVGSPREVYNAPRDTFVAGFIGSPSMNFLDGTIMGAGGGVRVRGKGFDLPVPARLHDALSRHLGNKVTVGLRPEHFSAPGAGGARGAALAPIDLRVDVARGTSARASSSPRA